MYLWFTYDYEVVSVEAGGHPLVGIIY